MRQKVFVLFLWFPLTLLLLIGNLTLLISLTRTPGANAYNGNIQLVKITTSSSGSEQVLGATVQAGDARTLLLDAFLTKNQSPLAQFSDYIVERAVHYDIDYRLVPAIAMCESTGGKHIPSKNSFNAWGISVETGQTSGKNFDNWIHGIDWVSRYLHERYYSQGITDLIDIGKRYAPPSVATGNSWATCVDYFMRQIQ